MKLTLKFPIKFGEQGPPITELVFREEIEAGDMRGLKVSALADPTMDEVLKIASRLCAQPESLLAKLKMDDLAEVVAALRGFMQGGPSTGTAT